MTTDEIKTSLINFTKVGQGFRKMVTTTVTFLVEVAVIGFLGAQIGAYLDSKTIVHDCSTVALSKVGDSYINCSVVAPKKDAPTDAPR